MNSLLLSALLIIISLIGGLSTVQAQSVQNFLYYVNINQCEGKDASNYTLVQTFSTDSACDDITHNSDILNLIQIQSNGQKAVNGLQFLSSAVWNAGAYGQYERLTLIINGPLQGKYLYLKSILLQNDYLKKCSSILGFSYLTTKSLSLLISDNLNLNVLISPTGAYDVFKQGCSTVCSGQSYLV